MEGRGMMLFYGGQRDDLIFSLNETLTLPVENTNLPNSVANKTGRVANCGKGKGKCKFKIIAMWGKGYVAVFIFNLGARCR
jgi:hypothetical protein